MKTTFRKTQSNQQSKLASACLYCAILSHFIHRIAVSECYNPMFSVSESLQPIPGYTVLNDEPKTVLLW